MVQLRHAGAFLLRRTFVRTLPVTSSSVRGVGPAGAEAASRHGHGHGLTRRCEGGQMRRRLKWLALVPGVLCLALALMALADQRGPGLTSALFLALFFLSVPSWGADADHSSDSGKA